MTTASIIDLGRLFRKIGTALALLLVPVINVLAAAWLLVSYVRVGKTSHDAGLVVFSGKMIPVTWLGIVHAAFITNMVSPFFVVGIFSFMHVVLGWAVIDPPHAWLATIIPSFFLAAITGVVNGILSLHAWKALPSTLLAPGRGRARDTAGTGCLKASAILGMLIPVPVFVLRLTVGMLASTLIYVITWFVAMIGWFMTGTMMLHVAPGSEQPEPGKGQFPGRNGGSCQSSRASDFSSLFPPSTRQVAGQGMTCDHCGEAMPAGEVFWFCPSCGAAVR